MGYKDENIKHRLGINNKPKYKCPHCNKPLSIKTIPFMMICSSCNKTFKGENVIIKK